MYEYIDKNDNYIIHRELYANRDIFDFCLYYLCFILNHRIPVHRKDQLMFYTFCPQRDILLSEYSYFNNLA